MPQVTIKYQTEGEGDAIDALEEIKGAAQDAAEALERLDKAIAMIQDRNVSGPHIKATIDADSIGVTREQERKACKRVATQ